MKRQYAVGIVATLGLGLGLAAPAVPFQGDEDGDPVVTLVDGRQVRSSALDCLDLEIHAQIEAEWLQSAPKRQEATGRAEAAVFAPLYAARCGQ